MIVLKYIYYLRVFFVLSADFRYHQQYPSSLRTDSVTGKKITQRKLRLKIVQFGPKNGACTLSHFGGSENAWQKQNPRYMSRRMHIFIPFFASLEWWRCRDPVNLSKNSLNSTFWEKTIAVLSTKSCPESEELPTWSPPERRQTLHTGSFMSNCQPTL